MRKILLLTLLITVNLVGCFHRSHYQPKKYTDKSYHFLGLMKVEPASFDRSDDTLLSIHSDDFSSQDHYSGDKISLFWGLISIKDY